MLAGIAMPVPDSDCGELLVRVSWMCPQASAKQRAGRAGRVAPGTILYLYTREFHDKCMPKFDDPEMLRISLDKTGMWCKCQLTAPCAYTMAAARTME